MVDSAPKFEVPPARLPEGYVQRALAKREDGGFRHVFGSAVQVRMCGAKEEDIVHVRVRERRADDPASPYWGWESFKTPQEGYSMIFQHFHLLKICFPYGIEAAVERGDGRPVNLIIEEFTEAA